MKDTLSLVPTLEDTTPLTTLRQLVGERISDNEVGDGLEAALGDEMHFIRSTELYGLIPNWPASKISDADSGVLLRYEGIASDLETVDEKGQRLAAVIPLIGTMACFEVIDDRAVMEDESAYPGGVSSPLWAHEIAISVDHPIRIDTLEAGLAEARTRMAPDAEPPMLRVVRK